MYFITGSAGKFREVAEIIPNLEQLKIDLPEIQSADPKEIITAKLEAAQAHHQGAYIVEDTSLYFDSLNGLPGPLIKWFIEKITVPGLADLTEKLGNNKAQAISWIGYSPRPGEHYFFSGVIEGTIVAPRGEQGFSWDIIFQPNGYTRTFAEMSTEEKNSMSMRAQAARALVEHLKQ